MRTVCDLAFGGGRDRIEPEQRSGRHDDLAAALLRQRNQVGPLEETPALSTITVLPASSIGRQMSFEHRRWRAFDREVGVARKFLELHQRTGDALRVEPGLRLGAVPGGRAGEREARDAVGELAREHAADGAEAGDGDARVMQRWSLGSPRAGHALIRALRHSDKRDPSASTPRQWDLDRACSERASVQTSPGRKRHVQDGTLSAGFGALLATTLRCLGTRLSRPSRSR